MMFWFETKPDAVQNRRNLDVLKPFTNAEPGDGGMELGRFIARI